MCQKKPDFEPLSPIYGQNTGLRARWEWGLCLVTYQGGVWGLSCFWAKILKNRICGPVQAVSAKFSGDLKVAQIDSATGEPYPDVEPLSPIYGQNTGFRARWR